MSHQPLNSSSSSRLPTPLWMMKTLSPVDVDSRSNVEGPRREFHLRVVFSFSRVFPTGFFWTADKLPASESSLDDPKGVLYGSSSGTLYQVNLSRPCTKKEDTVSLTVGTDLTIGLRRENQYASCDCNVWRNQWLIARSFIAWLIALICAAGHGSVYQRSTVLGDDVVVKQRVAIAGGLVEECKVLLLDELRTFLDESDQVWFITLQVCSDVPLENGSSSTHIAHMKPNIIAVAKTFVGIETLDGKQILDQLSDISLSLPRPVASSYTTPTESPFAALSSLWDNVVLAYEPVWATGTRKVASPGQAREVL
nr:ABC transporter I family member 10-like [Tanacetum cinerariifolium]